MPLSDRHNEKCEDCGEQFDRWGLCPCIEGPAVCTGVPLPNEIHDVDDLRFRHSSMIAQIEDTHTSHPVVAMRIRYHDDDETLPVHESFTWSEVRPKVALRFAAQITKASLQSYAHTFHSIARSAVKNDPCWGCGSSEYKKATIRSFMFGWWLCEKCCERN